MTRDSLLTANRQETDKPTVREVEFVELQFPSGTILLNSSNVDITWGARAYLASPPILDIGDVTERSDRTSSKTVLRFSGIDATLLSRILTDDYHYAVVNIWLGYVDEEWQLVADPHVLVDNLLMSSASITADRGTQQIEISADGWELFGTRDAAVLVTPESQRLRYPGDSGMDRVSSILTDEIQWGGAFQRS